MKGRSVGTGFMNWKGGTSWQLIKCEKETCCSYVARALLRTGTKLFQNFNLCVHCSLGLPECIGPVPKTGGGHPIGEILLSTVCSPCHYFRTGEHFRTGSTTGKRHPFPSLPALPSTVS